MKQLNLYEAKTRLSELVDQASKGKTFVISKSGKPMAKLVPLDERKPPRIKFGLMKGEIKVADDFDAPLTEEALELFESGERP
ncbi:MAG: type II toxin-antitoxin system Phd/YefM family antitoxin [Nevskia sp.]|nr:type II toxin-antitoxin system Phd/YefM family antitoxin [Nevskia sp.]